MAQILCEGFFKSLSFVATNKAVNFPLKFQLRWRKFPCRKPKWMPTAPTKVFRIPEHPYKPPEEIKLLAELYDEYNRKMESIRKLFQEELQKKSEDSAMAIAQAKADQEEHLRLLEENRKENERVRLIREEALERRHEENALNLLQQYEELKKEGNERKKYIEGIVQREKVKSVAYLSYENLDEAIEFAIENPININFSISLNGQINWESVPPKEYQEYVEECLKESKC